MIEIIPGLPDHSRPESLLRSIATTELVVDTHEFESQTLAQFVEAYVRGIVTCEFNRFTENGIVNADLFDNFLCIPIFMGAIHTAGDFISRFEELPRYLRLLILKDLSSCEEILERERLVDSVFSYSELQRLEKEFPGKLTIQDFIFAHEGWSDGFHRNVDRIRAEFEGEVLF